MSSDELLGDHDFLSLDGDLRSGKALADLLPTPQGDAPNLDIMAAKVNRLDAAAGSGLRLAIERHLLNHPDGRVCIVPPTLAATRDVFLEMLTPLPDRVTLTAAGGPVQEIRHVLLPTTLIADPESAAGAASKSLRLSDMARISPKRAHLLAWAIGETAGNSLRHSTGARLPPALTATVYGRGRTIELAAIDLGTGISEAEAPGELLAAIPSRGDDGEGLGELVRRASSRRVDMAIEIFGGAARLFWSADQHVTSPGTYVPGTTVVVRIGAQR